MPASVEILNAEKLLRKLTIIPRAQKSEIQKAMGKKADEVTDMMRRLVPVLKKATRQRTPGALRDSIVWAWGPKIPRDQLKRGTQRAPEHDDLVLTIVAGNNRAFYARWVEFGTSRARARPFFFVSWRAHRTSVRRRMREAANKAAKRVAAT
jgi:HK97 gp10 family phage protein